MSREKRINISLFLGLSGLVIIFLILFPIVSYEVESRQQYPILINPLVKDEGTTTLADYDYTKASNWFPSAPEKEIFDSSKVTHYTISIPALGIRDATVSLGGEDLSESLIQYPGTSLPGKIGNSVVFGHSILPFFYDPENYLAIFSTLNKLEEEDEIYINYDGITYSYEVTDMFEVRPTDIQILEQNSDDSFISLVTCTPMGDPRKPKRLIVRARLTPAYQATEERAANADTWY